MGRVYVESEGECPTKPSDNQGNKGGFFLILSMFVMNGFSTPPYNTPFMILGQGLNCLSSATFGFRLA